MIQEVKTYPCRTCGSPNIVNNGHNRLGQQQYFRKTCGACRVLESRREAKKKTKAPS
jgi:transposase-like protein